MNIKTAAAAAAALVFIPSFAQAAAPLYGFQLSDSSEALSAAELATFLGAPNDTSTGLGSGFITYDFGAFRLVDGAGQDLNVYEVDNGGPEFHLLDVLVSADGIAWFNIDASSATAVDLVGDEAHGNASFRRSFDLAAAVTGLGASQFRYLRLDGTSSGAIGGATGFDVDAVAAINYVDATPVGGVPEPGAWAMMIMGFGAAGAMFRRRRALTAA